MQHQEWYIERNGYLNEEAIRRGMELGVSNHEVSAVSFFLKIIEWMSANY